MMILRPVPLYREGCDGLALGSVTICNPSRPGAGRVLRPRTLQRQFFADLQASAAGKWWMVAYPLRGMAVVSPDVTGTRAKWRRVQEPCVDSVYGTTLSPHIGISCDSLRTLCGAPFHLGGMRPGIARHSWNRNSSRWEGTAVRHQLLRPLLGVEYLLVSLRGSGWKVGGQAGRSRSQDRGLNGR